MSKPRKPAYFLHFEQSTLPDIRSSAISLSLFDGTVNAKNSMELGACILLDKPIILICKEGVTVPPKLMGVADEVIWATGVDDPQLQGRIKAALARVLPKRGEEKPE